MSLQQIGQIPLTLDAGRKENARSQFGALCYRQSGGKTEVLLITSRRAGRWIIPRGWPIARKSPAQTVATEAWEEAGVEGRVHPLCLGIYSYIKGSDRYGPLPCVVAVYGLKVKRLAESYPEHGQRKRKWVSPKRAADMVRVPELSQMLARFDPKSLPI